MRQFWVLTGRTVPILLPQPDKEKEKGGKPDCIVDAAMMENNTYIKDDFSISSGSKKKKLKNCWQVIKAKNWWGVGRISRNLLYILTRELKWQDQTPKSFLNTKKMCFIFIVLKNKTQKRCPTCLIDNWLRYIKN